MPRGVIWQAVETGVWRRICTLHPSSLSCLLLSGTHHPSMQNNHIFPFSAFRDFIPPFQCCNFMPVEVIVFHLTAYLCKERLKCIEKVALHVPNLFLCHKNLAYHSPQEGSENLTSHVRHSPPNSVTKFIVACPFL